MMASKVVMTSVSVSMMSLVWASDTNVLPGYLTDPKADEIRKAANTTENYRTPPHLRFPYVSTYYVKPIVKVGEEVRIGYYVTDWDSSKERFLDDSCRFDMHLEYSSEGAAPKFQDHRSVKTGDGAFALGKLPVGNYTVRIWSVDRRNKLESHRVIQEFRVVPRDYFDLSKKTYVMTEADLKSYAIDNKGELKDDDAALRNLENLQRFIDDKATNGIRKVVLLKGIYRVSHRSMLHIPTEFTLDLNGATIKEHPFAGDKAKIVDFFRTQNSHLINGTVEGDCDEHDYKGSKNSSEWCHGVTMTGDCRDSSLRNVTVKNITGYGGENGCCMDGRMRIHEFLQYLKGKWSPGGLDRKTGEVVADPARFTCDFQPVPKEAKEAGYLQISRYLGYQGRSSRSWWMTVCWYDLSKKLVSAETAFQYRELMIPQNTAFLRFSIEETSLEKAQKSDLTICRFRYPRNCAVIGCRFDRCRAVGYAPCAMRNFLFLRNEFTGCGWALAKCAFDAEDGWDQMQDVFFFENSCHDNPVNNNLLACCGHNFVFERNTCGIWLWHRVYSPCVRNNELTSGSAFHCHDRMWSGYGRFADNRYAKGLEIGTDRACGWDYVLSGMEFGSTNFVLMSGETARFVASTIRGKGVRPGNLYRCKVLDCDSSVLAQRATWQETLVKNSRFGTGRSTNRYERCSFENVTIDFDHASGVFEKCRFKDFIVANMRRSTVVFKDCEFFRSHVLSNGYVDPSSLSLVNCRLELDDNKPFLQNKLFGITDVNFENCIVRGTQALVDIGSMHPHQDPDNRQVSYVLKRCDFRELTSKSVFEASQNIAFKGMSHRVVDISASECNIPKATQIILPKVVREWWKVAER